jgi:hypothetical protein
VPQSTVSIIGYRPRTSKVAREVELISPTIVHAEKVALLRGARRGAVRSSSTAQRIDAALVPGTGL